MFKGFLNLPWFVWAGLAFIIALIYTFWVPQKIAPDASGLQLFIIRWAHPLTWYLLTVNFILRDISPEWNGLANLIAIAGGLSYLLFMLMTFVVK
ncbi:MAG: hypothetical protein KJZ72_13810 [Anaerolineales bacterium]|nr:hypothetical protein [Anaerolineales bacterium]